MFYLQWRTLFTVLLPWILQGQFKEQSRPTTDPVSGKVTHATYHVHPDVTRDLQRLCILLGAVVSIAFTRVNYNFHIARCQRFVLHFNLLFAKRFPNDTTPMMHFAMHFQGNVYVCIALYST